MIPRHYSRSPLIFNAKLEILVSPEGSDFHLEKVFQSRFHFLKCVESLRI